MIGLGISHSIAWQPTSGAVGEEFKDVFQSSQDG